MFLISPPFPPQLTQCSRSIPYIVASSSSSFNYRVCTTKHFDTSDRINGRIWLLDTFHSEGHTQKKSITAAGRSFLPPQQPGFFHNFKTHLLSFGSSLSIQLTKLVKLSNRLNYAVTTKTRRLSNYLLYRIPLCTEMGENSTNRPITFAPRVTNSYSTPAYLNVPHEVIKFGWLDITIWL